MHARSCRRENPTPSAAFTLIEIVVVVGIVILVAGVALALFQGLRQSLTRQSLRQDLHGQADAALGRVLRDLSCALRPAGTNQATFLYTPDDGGNEGALLRFRTAQLAKNPRGSDAFVMEVVEYELSRRDALEPGGHLIRVSQMDVAGGTRKAPNEISLASDVTLFSLRLYNGDDWIEKWEDSSVLPQAARVYLTLERGKETVSLDGETLIACGHVISGR